MRACRLAPREKSTMAGHELGGEVERSDLQALCDDLLLGQDFEGVVLLGVLDQHDLPKGTLPQHLDLL